MTPDKPSAPRPEAVKKRPPDPRPLRTAVGFTGLAAFTAIATAIVTPAGSASASGTVSQATQSAPAAQQVVHVKRTIVLQPGQTAPPQAVVTQLPAPTPRTVVVRTTQSGRVVP